MSNRFSQKIIALLPVFNDSRYLNGWIEAVGQHVDGVVALDDGSTDDSLAILSSATCITKIIRIKPENKVAWDEPLNRELLVSAGQKLGADWFVAFDTDERPDSKLWTQLNLLVEEADATRAIGIKQPLREIWDYPDQYRCDGIWGRKQKVSIFRNLESDHQFDTAQWHGEWYPAQFLGTDRFLSTELNLYHLKMLQPEDRDQRMKRYQRLDPNRKFQEGGYEYLVDEADIELALISPAEGYTGMISIADNCRTLKHG